MVDVVGMNTLMTLHDCLMGFAKAVKQGRFAETMAMIRQLIETCMYPSLPITVSSLPMDIQFFDSSIKNYNRLCSEFYAQHDQTTHHDNDVSRAAFVQSLCDQDNSAKYSVSLAIEAMRVLMTYSCMIALDGEPLMCIFSRGIQFDHDGPQDCTERSKLFFTFCTTFHNRWAKRYAIKSVFKAIMLCNHFKYRVSFWDKQDKGDVISQEELNVRIKYATSILTNNRGFQLGDINYIYKHVLLKNKAKLSQVFANLSPDTLYRVGIDSYRFMQKRITIKCDK